MRTRVTATGEQTSLAERKRLAGQRLILGLAGPSVTDDLRYLVRELQPAGFILFARNVEEPAQVRELNRELASLVDPRTPALLSVDQEGGRVQRVRDPATRWPPMRMVGAAARYTAEVSTAIAVELRAMGFHLNFAPVADVDSNPDNPVIGDRAFSRDPQEVAEHVVAFLQAHQAAHVIACAKHFPGHGDTTTDSHLELPCVEEELPRLLSRELVPFRAAVAAGVGAVMTAHVVFPALDEDLPATLSPRVVPELLRGKLGFDGVVISDDMEMKAVHGRWEVPVLARLTTEATVDLLLCCKEPALQIEMYHALVHLQEEDPRHERACRTSARRVQALRERFLLHTTPQPPLSVLGQSEHRILAERIRHEGG
jgi:beta-N-acetylhexosaminidase